MFGLHRLGLALCNTSIPLGLFGEHPGLVIFFVVHGDFGLLELVLGRLHFHRGELGAAGAHGVVDGRLGDRVLLGRRVTGATGQGQAAAEGQRRQLEAARMSERGCAGSGFHGLQLHWANS
ncbi:hypothetical protein D9M73_208580 [compost metagenome]